MLAYGIYQHLAISSYGFSRWSGTMPHTEITANLDWKHVAYVRNMYDVRTNGDRAIFDCDPVCYGLIASFPMLTRLELYNLLFLKPCLYCNNICLKGSITAILSLAYIL